MWFFSSKKRKKDVASESSGSSRPRPPPRPSTAPSRPDPPPRPRPHHHHLAHPAPQQLPPQDQYWNHHHHHQNHSTMAVQHAGYLPAPETCASQPPGAPPPYPHQPQCQPIVVNQYYLPSLPDAATITAKKSMRTLDKLGDSVAYLANDMVGDVIPQAYGDSLTGWQTYGTQVVNQTAAMVDQITSRLNHIMTMIDGEQLSGHERDLFTYQPVAQPPQPSRSSPPPKSKTKKDKNTRGQSSEVIATTVSGGYFSKVNLYANSRLPRDLPPLRLYVSTWPLICAAAKYSERVYAAPKGAEKDTHVSANWRGGTRAMVIKSVPMDDQSVIVFAIRGTSTFMDWAVNLNTEPTAPVGFLDDPGNLCHAGFLSSAKSMLPPVAARLRQLLKDNPGRKNSSLLITGHSAGGAVAALLYAHMHSSSRSARSELSVLAGSFKRIHCITFGAPPVSLLPLGRAGAGGKSAKGKSVFLSFVNEGDPVVRAEKAYVRSLVELLAAPDPVPKKKGMRKEGSRQLLASKKSLPSTKLDPRDTVSKWGEGPVWRVPDCTLSLAGRIVVLRSRDGRTGRGTVGDRMREGVVAVTAGDGEIRGVVWGDPVCHVMRFYSKRVEALAVEAITAGK